MSLVDFRKESEGLAEVMELLESRIGAAIPPGFGTDRLRDFAERILDPETWLDTQGTTVGTFLGSLRERRVNGGHGPASLDYVDLLVGADADASLRTLATSVADRAAAAGAVLIGAATRPYAHRFVIELDGDGFTVDAFFNSEGRYTSVRRVGSSTPDARSVVALELVEGAVGECRRSAWKVADDPLAASVLDCCRRAFDRHGIAVEFVGADDYTVRLRADTATIVFAHNKSGAWTKAYLQPGRGASPNALEALNEPMERALACLRERDGAEAR